MMKNILAVVAHPDDLEMMAGGSLLLLKSLGCSIHVLLLTNGSWRTPENVKMRPFHLIKTEIENVSRLMEYDSLRYLNNDALSIHFCDTLVCEVLKEIKIYNIDTIFTCWEHDTNHDHRVAAEVAISAARSVPRILMGQINYYLHDAFVPNMYIDISSYWDKKIEVMSKYVGEWERQGENWTEFMDATSTYYGKIVGTRRAEGFVVKKYLL